MKLFYWEKLTYSYRKLYSSEAKEFEMQAFAPASSKEHATEILVEDFLTNILTPLANDRILPAAEVAAKKEELRS